MSKEDLKQQLIEHVIDHIKLDMFNGNYTEIDKLLGSINNKNLIQFLPEREREKYKDLI